MLNQSAESLNETSLRNLAKCLENLKTFHPFNNLIFSYSQKEAKRQEVSENFYAELTYKILTLLENNNLEEILHRFALQMNTNLFKGPLS